MDISEIKSKREQAEKEIENIIGRFVEETSAVVTLVDYSYARELGNRYSCFPKVVIKIEI